MQFKEIFHSLSKLPFDIPKDTGGVSESVIGTPSITDQSKVDSDLVFCRAKVLRLSSGEVNISVSLYVKSDEKLAGLVDALLDQPIYIDDINSQTEVELLPSLKTIFELQNCIRRDIELPQNLQKLMDTSPSLFNEVTISQFYNLGQATDGQHQLDQESSFIFSNNPISSNKFIQ
ncbi:hypothetical protein KBC75_01950 [Candidatus Shapirobacteria bacterium]|nr:hypothetical protein [Candidatus Shapirobacteria bacterium]